MSRAPIELLRPLNFDDPSYQREVVNENEEKKSADIESPADHSSLDGQETSSIPQDNGVTRIEALYLVFGKGWGLWALWGSIGLIAYVYSLSRTTTYVYAAFATSAFGTHTIVGTIGVINAILNGVSQPFIAKIADIWSRPHTLAVAVTLYAVGYAMCAGAQNVQTVVAGQVFYTIGNSGITFLNSLIIADITSLQWRPFVDGAVNLPYVLNAFVAGYITSGISAFSTDGWRWGYGMFAIVLPVCVSPALVVLMIGDYRARKIGAVSLAASSKARRQQLEGQPIAPSRTVYQIISYYWTRLDGLGFLLMGFSFALLLTPMTLNTTAKGGYTNPSLIAMLVIGGVLFIGWAVWDGFFAQYPLMPKRVFNRTFIACVTVDFFYLFSSYLTDTYFSSWVYVVVDWSARDYTFFTNTLSVTQCSLAIFAGLIMRITHRYKYLQISGLAIRIIGLGLMYQSTLAPTAGFLVSCQVLIGLGGAISITSSWVAVQASVPHRDMGMATAVLNLWSSIGSSISIAISSAVWNKQVPANLDKYIGSTHNSTEIADIFGSIVVARLAEPRDQVKLAYQDSVRGLFLSAMIVSCLALLASFFASNFYLGEAHNTIETDKIIKFREKREIEEIVKGQD